MVPGFFEMQSLMTKGPSYPEVDGEKEYRKLEFGTERFYPTPESGERLRNVEAPRRFSFRKLIS